MENTVFLDSKKFPDFSVYKNVDLQIDESKETRLLDLTLVGCEKCNIVTSAKILQNGNIVYLEKECCGEKSFLDDNPELFRKLYLQFLIKDENLKVGENLDQLLERMRQNATMLMVYINSKCNLDCPICYLKFSEMNSDSSTAMPISDMSKLLSLNKKSKLVCLTGMEPTLVEDLPQMIKTIRKSGRLCEIVTNGIKLLNRDYLRTLVDAGIWRVFTWFDGFDNSVYQTLRGGNFLNAKLKLLKLLKDEKVPTELVAVIGRGINEDQVGPIIDFAMHNTDFISGICMDCLTTGKTYTEYTMSPSRLHELVAEQIGVDLEYFVQFKRLRYNLYYFIKNLFGDKFSSYQKLVSDNYFFEVKNGRLTPILSLEEMEKLNLVLENNKTKLKALIGILKNARILTKLSKVLLPRILPLHLPDKIGRVLFRILNKRYLRISISRPVLWLETIGYKGSYTYSDFDPVGPRAYLQVT